MASFQSSLAVMHADMQAALQERARTPDMINEVAPAANINNAEDAGQLDAIAISRVIEMAWEDRTPFAAIEQGYGLAEPAVIKLMRDQLKPSSFRMWRQRVSGRATKHQAKRSFIVGRDHCQTQYKPR